MKKIIAFIMMSGLFLSSLQIFSQDSLLAELLGQHKAKVQELARLRQKALSEDEDLKALHEQILELHAKLASKLEQKPEIKKLHDEIISLEKDIEARQSENEKKKFLRND